MSIRSKRLVAILIDFLIAITFTVLLNKMLVSINIILLFPMIGIIAWIIIFCKDSFRGASIGKRIVGIQVLNADTGQIASPTKCIIRNLFILIFPLELFLLFYNQKRLRVGDYAAHTKVAQYDKTLKGFEFSQIIQAIGYVLIGLILYEIFIYYRASSLGLLLLANVY